MSAIASLIASRSGLDRLAGVAPRFEARELARFIIVPRRDEDRISPRAILFDPGRLWRGGGGGKPPGLRFIRSSGSSRVLLVLTVDPMPGIVWHGPCLAAIATFEPLRAITATL